MTRSTAARLRFLGGMVAIVVATGVGTTGAGTTRARADGPADGHARWVAAWTASSTRAPADGANCPARSGVADATVRNVVFPSAGGDRVRVRLTNVFGDRPLRVGRATIAVRGDGAALVPGTVRTLRFSGKTGATVRAGGLALSDPVALPVRAGRALAVSVYLPRATGPATQHPLALQDGYLAAGDRSVTGSGAAYATTTDCQLFADAVDVAAGPRVTGTVVTLGDSITDGAQSTPNTNRRWPDGLARRMQARHGATLAVANAGISGNEVLIDREPVTFGPSALHRLDRDVLGQPGLRDVILLEGINDIGGDAASADQIIAGYRKIIARVHAHGARIFGGTLTAFAGSNGQYGGQYGTAWGERQRLAVNHWIRASGAFDAIIDFDHATADPANPHRMAAKYDSGDHLHPGDTGYARMSTTVDISALLGAH